MFFLLIRLYCYSCLNVFESYSVHASGATVKMDTSRDLNNNAAEGKSYSLRPRCNIKSNRDMDQDDEMWKPRGRTKKRSKQRTAPLSKYRRKTANARERSRMREINEAFEALRRAVPHLNSNSEVPGEKISKIMTLRLAMKYITALSNALQEPCLGEVSLNEITIGYDSTGGLTPGSLSEHSEFSDDFFSTALYTESLSPANYDSSTAMTSPLCRTMHLPSFNRLRETPSSSSSILLQTLSTAVDKSLTSSHRQTFSLASPCDLRTHTLTPPDDVSRNFANFHYKEHPMHPMASSLPASSFLSPEFDGLPSPAMDLDDLFIK